MPVNVDGKIFYTIAEAAMVIGKAEVTVKHHVYHGHIESRIIGRMRFIAEDQLELIRGKLPTGGAGWRSKPNWIRKSGRFGVKG